MRYRIVAVGRRAQDPLAHAAEDYLGRLHRYVKCELVRVRDGSPRDETKRLRDLLDRATGRVVALDEHGETFTTRTLARHVEAWPREGPPHTTFVIGGADGLDASIKALATETWALSAFTLPHRLALVVLAEQLYRVHTVMRGEAYHRA